MDDLKAYHPQDAERIGNISKEDLETIMLFVVGKLRSDFYDNFKRT
jgi:hypothetical protein